MKTSYFPELAGKRRGRPLAHHTEPHGGRAHERPYQLHYGYTKVEYLGYGMSLIGLVGLVWLWRSGAVTIPPEPPPPASIHL